MKSTVPINITMLAVPVVMHGKRAYFVDRHGKTISRGVHKSRIGPLSGPLQETLLWQETAAACLNRLRARAGHFRHRGPWETKAFALKTHLYERKRALQHRSAARPRTSRIPTTWPSAASVMIARLYHVVYRAKHSFGWERWALGKGQCGRHRRYK